MLPFLKYTSLAVLLATANSSCNTNNTSDDRQRDQQEVMLQQATTKVGMPAINNFRERELMRMILELRDQSNLVTYTYVYNEYSGKFVFIGESIGYAIPYATQYTNPEKDIYYGTSSAQHMALPQADPNGLFMPSSAEGSWVMLKDPKTGDVKPWYSESRLTVSPFKMADRLVQGDQNEKPVWSQPK